MVLIWRLSLFPFFLPFFSKLLLRWGRGKVTLGLAFFCHGVAGCESPPSPPYPHLFFLPLSFLPSNVRARMGCFPFLFFTSLLAMQAPTLIQLLFTQRSVERRGVNMDTLFFFTLPFPPGTPIKLVFLVFFQNTLFFCGFGRRWWTHPSSSHF